MLIVNIDDFYDKFASGSIVAPAILSLSIMLLAGFLMTRITKKLRLPNVTAYIVAGILIGPYFLNLIPGYFLKETSFLPDLALAFIAFSTGNFFKVEVLKKNGIKVVVITLFEALMASILVFILCFWLLKLPLPFSSVIAALAAATAPASTMMTIRQTKAKGEFVDTLLQVVALDDIVGLMAYSIAISVATAAASGKSISILDSIIPFLLNLLILFIGGVFGILLSFSMKRRHSTDNRLIIAIAFLFTFCGIASIVQVSPLLGCMAMGSVYINITDDDRLFKQLNYFSPPILLIFFVRSGVSFDLGALFSTGRFGAAPLIVVGIGYFLVRIMGKYLGAYVGCRIVGSGIKVQRYLGLALIPQAGVAIGLAELGSRAIGGEMGNALLTIILASSVLYELIGPAAAKLSLYLSGSYGDDEQTDAESKEEAVSETDCNNTIKDNSNPTEETCNSDINNLENAEYAKGTDEKNLMTDVSDPNNVTLSVFSTDEDGYDVENLNERSFDEGAEEYFQNQFDEDPPKKKKKDKKDKKSDKKKKDKKDKKSKK